MLRSVSHVCADMFVRLFAMLFACLLLPSCNSKPPVVKTQNEIHAFQTHTFNDQEKPVIMKSILNVLQEDGYVVKNVSLELGYVSAVRERDIEDKSDHFWAYFSKAGESRWQKNECIETTVTLFEFKNGIRARTNFQKKIIDNMGVMLQSNPIVEEEFYIDFFDKVGKGICLQQEY